ncbi:MAG: GTP-binding protein [Candidatus Lokiarchaeota archaeon]|nr:GTP-binding protein [Candidatus Lokiarchaeota archaeon]
MSFLRKIFKKSKKKVNLVICGLDAAGKTSILNFLITGKSTETVPTMGVNYERFKLKNLEINMCDLGGQKVFRQFWGGVIDKSNSLIFVLDSTDRERVEEAKRELFESLKYISPTLPILVLANKQDIKDCMTTDEILKNFDLINLSNRMWHLEGTSAVTGKGLKESFLWLYERLTGEKIQKELTTHDILIFNRGGIPIVSKSKVFEEVELASGFLSAINTFASQITNQSLDTITMGKYKVVFQQIKELVGAIVLNISDNEDLAMKLLHKLLNQIIEKGLENANQILEDFVVNELKDYASPK